MPPTVTVATTLTSSTAVACSHLAVVDQQGIALVDVLDEAFEPGGADVLGTGTSSVVMVKASPTGRCVRAINEPGPADLRPLQVSHVRHRPAEIGCSLPGVTASAVCGVRLQEACSDVSADLSEQSGGEVGVLGGVQIGVFDQVNPGQDHFNRSLLGKQ